jgi:cadmium resistance protein CadD (predicted permease)
VPHLTLIDKFFLACYVFVFVAIIELMTVHLSHRTREGKLAARIRRHSRWIVPLAFVIVNAILIVQLGMG